MTELRLKEIRQYFTHGNEFTWDGADKYIDELFEEIRSDHALVFEMFRQACLERGEIERYDHMCLSTYEYAQDELISWGDLKPEQCSRR